MSLARTLLASVSVAAALALASCSRPTKPRITPISGRVVGISNTGITVEAKLEANNKNDFEVDISSFSASLKLDNNINIGPVTGNQAIKLPANKRTQFDVPITFKWNDVLALAPLALGNRDVPYEAEGTVNVSAASLDIDVPFKVTGLVTRAQMKEAVGKSMPKIPGLPVPF